MKKAVLIVGIIGVVLSLGVVGVSFGLHLMNPRNISIDEAMLGIVPGSLCCSLSFLIAGVGLVLVLMPARGESPKHKRREEDDEDSDD